MKKKLPLWIFIIFLELLFGNNIIFADSVSWPYNNGYTNWNSNKANVPNEVSRTFYRYSNENSHENCYEVNNGQYCANKTGSYNNRYGTEDGGTGCDSHWCPSGSTNSYYCACCMEWNCGWYKGPHNPHNWDGGNCWRGNLQDDKKTVCDTVWEGSWGGWSSWQESYPGTNNGHRKIETITMYSYPITYSISYNLNGATNSPNNRTTYTVLDSFSLINPFRTGYQFTGWTGSNGDAPQTYVSISRQTGNKNYTANWKANTYTVCYIYNHETIQKDQVCTTMTYDTSATINGDNSSSTNDNSSLDTEFYWFKGWNTKKDGTGTTYNEGSSVKNLTTVNNATIYLYGKWQIKNYYIEFDANAESIGGGVSGSTPKQTILFTKTTDTNVPLNNSGFSKQGYVQIGWSKTKNSKTVDYEIWYTKNTTGTQKIDSHGTNTIVSQTAYFNNWINNNGEPLVQPGKTITLYAVWARKTYLYNLNCLSSKEDSSGTIKEGEYADTSLAETSTVNNVNWKKDDSNDKNIYVNEDETKYYEIKETYCHYAPTNSCTSMCIADNDYTYIITWEKANNYNISYGTNMNCSQ